MGGMKAKAQDFFVVQRERSTALEQVPSSACRAETSKGTQRDGEDVKAPVAAAGAAGEFAAGNKRRELGKERGCEEDLHSWLDLFSVALPNWKDVFC